MGCPTVDVVQNKLTAPEGFSQNYVIGLNQKFVSGGRVGDGHRSLGEGWCVCWNSRVHICDLSGTAEALWNVTRNTLRIPLG